MTGAQIAWHPGGRLHLHHGPIDVILQGWGDPSALHQGYQKAAEVFPTILPALCAELPSLRLPNAVLNGPIARRMQKAVRPFHPAFITPMAAVAGAVAEAVLAAFVGPGISRAYANNGGDIALHLNPGESLTCAIAARRGAPDRITIRAHDAVRGIATSGWRGRSHSLGIADSVTVLARSAAMADAAATMIANAVDLPRHPAITRRHACDLSPDSDLGHRLVTTAVGPLDHQDIEIALGAGETAARRFLDQGLIEGAALFLHPSLRTVGHLALAAHATQPAAKEPFLV